MMHKLSPPRHQHICALILVVFDCVYWQQLAVTVGLDDYACIGYNIATIQSVLLTVLI